MSGYGRYKQVGFWLLVALLILGGVVVWVLPLLWQNGPGLLALLRDEEALERFVAWLGWMGPPALILLNALQIVVAPVPAYALFIAAGFLYGTVWGGIYGTVGTLLGATAAMLLTRRFGRPLAARMVGEDRLDQWSQMTVSRSTITWAILLLAPVGDLPFFLAGLSQVGVWRILVLTLITRVPTIFLIAAAANGSAGLPWWQVALLVAVLLAGFGLLFRHQDRILAWCDQRLAKWLNRSAAHAQNPTQETIPAQCE